MGFQSSKGHEISPGLVTSKFCPMKHVRFKRGMLENEADEKVEDKAPYPSPLLPIPWPQEPLTSIWTLPQKWCLKKEFLSKQKCSKPFVEQASGDRGDQVQPCSGWFNNISSWSGCYCQAIPGFPPSRERRHRHKFSGQLPAISFAASLFCKNGAINIFFSFSGSLPKLHSLSLQGFSVFILLTSSSSIWLSCCCCSVSKLCPTLWDPYGLHYLSEFVQT